MITGGIRRYAWVLIILLSMVAGIAAGLGHENASTVPMGIDWYRAGNDCAAFGAIATAGDFFNGLKRHDTKHGPEYKRKSAVVTEYPDSVLIILKAGLSACAHPDTEPSNDNACAHPDTESSNGNTPPLMRLDAAIIGALRFEAFWKDNFTMKPAQVAILSSRYVGQPYSIRRSANWWEYTLKVRTQGIPINYDLILIALAPDRHRLARFALRP